MKIQWEEADVVSGRKYRKPGTGETWMIGYVGGSGRCRVSISLSDGMVTESRLASVMAQDLTDGGYWPVEFLTTNDETRG